MTTASSNTTRPLPDQRTPVIDRYRRWTTTWWAWIKPLLESVDKNSTDIVTVTAQITTVEAAYQAADATISASVTTEATARASADGTLASYYTIYTNANGRVTGAVQLSSTTAAGSASPSLSTFAVLADKFIIVHPSANGTTMQAFVVGNVNGVSTVGINGNLLVDGTIVANAIAAGAITAAKLDVGSLSAISANVGTVTAGVLQSADGKMRIDLNAKTITMEA